MQFCRLLDHIKDLTGHMGSQVEVAERLFIV